MQSYVQPEIPAMEPTFEIDLRFSVQGFSPDVLSDMREVLTPPASTRPARKRTPKAQRTDRPFEKMWLYRYWDACDCLLYVGITNELSVRDKEHWNSSPWHPLAVRRTLEDFATREAAEEAEGRAVRGEEPAFNKMLRPAADTNEALRKYMAAHTGKLLVEH